MSELLQVRDLTVRYGGSERRAVDQVSFSLDEGEVLGVVGESGSGKTTLGTALLGLLPSGATATGSVVFDGVQLLGATQQQLRPLRGRRLSTIMQNASTALNPSFTIGHQLTALLRKHRGLSRADARAEAISWLGKVGIPAPEARLKAFPHTLSGGMNQRVAIAMALALHPKMVIADEPTSALDVTVQAAVLRLLRTLIDDSNSAMVLITHDLGVVAQLCSQVIVMNGGAVVESASVETLFADPQHPYTRRLLAALPGRRAQPAGPPGVEDPSTGQDLHATQGGLR